jgi:hypothetical protein
MSRLQDIRDSSLRRELFSSFPSVPSAVIVPQHGRLSHEEDNIKVDIKNVGYEDVSLIRLAENMVCWKVLVKSS